MSTCARRISAYKDDAKGGHFGVFPGDVTTADTQGPDDPAIAWVQLVEKANEAFKRGDAEDAKRCWRESYRLSNAEWSPPHPLIAASLCNCACVFRVEENHEDGVRCATRSIELWKAAEAWVAGMRLESTARSSTFHLRMQGRHHDAYRRPRLDKYQASLDLGRTTAMNNLAEIFHASGRLEEARDLYSRALSEREEAARTAKIDDAVIAVIRRNLLAAEGKTGREVQVDETNLYDRNGAFVQLARDRRWLVDSPPVLTDEGALMAAVLLPRTLARRDF